MRYTQSKVTISVERIAQAYCLQKGENSLGISLRGSNTKPFLASYFQSIHLNCTATAFSQVKPKEESDLPHPTLNPINSHKGTIRTCIEVSEATTGKSLIANGYCNIFYRIY